jgi:hypothetical protein
MKPKNKCPKCGAKMGDNAQYTLKCRSLITTGIDAGFSQSQYCKKRVQVQRLKRKMEELTTALDAETRAFDQLRRELVVIRNPNF